MLQGMGRAALLGPVVVALLACGEPSPLVHVTVRLPSVTATPDPARLVIESDDSGDRAFVPHLSRAVPANLKAFPGGFEGDVGTGIGPTRYVVVHGWYDANGNGRVDSGDAVGDLAPAPFAASDGGGCRSRMNRAPDLVLKPLP